MLQRTRLVLQITVACALLYTTQGHFGTHNCILRPGGVVKCFGRNLHGQCGVSSSTENIGDEPNELGPNLVTVDLGNKTATALFHGFSHTCAILNTGFPRCWGRNEDGELGVSNVNGTWTPLSGTSGFLAPTLFSFATSVVSMALGDGHTCALLESGKVRCWGSNQSGQLGLGLPQNTSVWNTTALDLGTGRTAIAITSGRYHVCAILDNAATVCWGATFWGQLGTGTNVKAYIGLDASDMGDSLTPVNFGPGRTAKRLSAGSFHTCAILDNDDVMCWGRNDFGQLGRGNTEDIGDNNSEMQGNGTVRVDIGEGRRALNISSGGRHTCIYTNTSEILCWGNGNHAQLGTGATDNRGDEPNEMGSSAITVSLGSNSPTSVVVGRNHTCAVLVDGDIVCWGSNKFGEVGIGNTNIIGDIPAEMGDALQIVDMSDYTTTTTTTTTTSTTTSTRKFGIITTCKIL